MRTPLLTIGILALLIGLLWIGQGTGVVRWPQSSFMIDQIMWAWYGAGVSLFGFGLVVLAYRGKS